MDGSSHGCKFLMQDVFFFSFVVCVFQFVFGFCGQVRGHGLILVIQNDRGFKPGNIMPSIKHVRDTNPGDFGICSWI